VAPGHEIFGVLDGAAEVEQGHVPEISGAEDAFSVGVGSDSRSVARARLTELVLTTRPCS
jgi:hypothetical protein